MPTYEYKCFDCEHAMEHFQKITDNPLKTCPSCGKESLKRGPGGGIGLSFKGSGFYITDYAAKKPEHKCCKTEKKEPEKAEKSHSCCCKKKD